MTRSEFIARRQIDAMTDGEYGEMWASHAEDEDWDEAAAIIRDLDYYMRPEALTALVQRAEALRDRIAWRYVGRAVRKIGFGEHGEQRA